VTAERRAEILGHVAAIARKPWRGETVADQRAELTAFAAVLRRRGEHADPDVMIAINAAQRQIA
jgi:hypothetical protein